MARYIVQQSENTRKSGRGIGGYYGVEVDGSINPNSHLPNSGGNDIGERGTGGTLKASTSSTKYPKKHTAP